MVATNAGSNAHQVNPTSLTEQSARDLAEALNNAVANAEIVKAAKAWADAQEAKQNMEAMHVPHHGAGLHSRKLICGRVAATEAALLATLKESKNV